jgi:phthiocerol/phenolphthiocerol synthesis type-I polyketide synthase E
VPGQDVDASAGLENAVRSAWREALGIDEIAGNDNFFDLGGDSLAAVIATQAVLDMTGVDVPLETLFAAEDLDGYIDVVRSVQEAP